MAHATVAALLPDQSSALPDILAYRTAASELASGHLISNDFVMPGYPLLVALSGGVLGQRIVDIVLASLSAWCVARITVEVTFDELAGLIAGLIWAVYPFSLFYAAVGLTETTFVAFVLLGFLAFYRAKYFLGSIAMLAAILTRPSVEILAPILVLVFALVVHRSDRRQSLRHLGTFAAVYVLMMFPWWAHNEAKYGQFVRLNLADGFVLYSGNNPMNQTGGGIRSVDFDPSSFIEIQNPVERNRAMRDAAIHYILENPSRFVELAWLKFLRLWRPWPYASEYARPFLMFLSALTLLPLMLLAAIGFVFLLEKSWRRLIPIALFISFTTAVHVVTIGSVRYRFPMAPFLVVLAAPILAFAIRRLLSIMTPPTERISST